MRWFRAVCVAAAVCAACGAKPPGLPIDPRAEGRELDPLARDHYAPVPPAAQGEPEHPHAAPVPAARPARVLTAGAPRLVRR